MVFSEHPSQRSLSTESDDINVATTTKIKNNRFLLCVIILSVSVSLLLCGILAIIMTDVFSHKDSSEQTLAKQAISPSASPETELSSSIDILPLSGKTIILDAGHGGYDNGCVYPSDEPVYLEKEYNLTTAFETKSVLEELGATVYMIRTDDSFISIYARAAMVHLFCLDYATEHDIPSISNSLSESIQAAMNDTILVNSTDISAGCMGPMVGSGFSDDMIAILEFEYTLDDVLFLSIHNNWNSQTSLHGTQVYYVIDESIIESEERLIREDSYYTNPDYIVRNPYYGRDGDRNASLAQIMYDSITATTPELITNTPQIVTDNFAVLREHGLASVMLELTYVSNPDDRDLLENGEVIRKMAEGIGVGCVEYFSSLL